MRHLKIFIAVLIVLAPGGSFAQTSKLSLGFWNIYALSGELKVGGLYGTGDINTYGIHNRITTANYYGGILLKSSSYIWNPNFMTVDIDGGYYPESRQDLYLVSPNLYNVINTRKLHLGSTLFPKKMITLYSYLNFDDSYDSRENLTDIKTQSQGWGETFSFRNKYLPVVVAYSRNKWDSKEMNTNRDFSYNQENLEARASKSFGRNDKNDLIYTHHDYLRRDYSLYSIRNISDNLELQNGYFLDSAQRSYYNSNILGTSQRGNDSFKQLRVNENFFWKLPHRVTFNGSYGYYFIERGDQRLGQHTVNGLLGHQLYESLHSGLLYEYNNSMESSYHEVSNKVGVDLSYSKKTFANGLLNITYSYNKVFQNRASSDVLLKVNNEEYTISDRVMLRRPYIDTATLQLRNADGTTIYQRYLDYEVNQIGNFIEILRIPGGMVPENGKVYAFYSATQPGSYKYEVNLQNFAIDLSLFDHFVDIYYKTNRTDFSNVNHADNLLLDYLTEEIYGSSLKYKTATLGAEFDDYRSSLVPYKMMRYYFTWQGNYKQRLLFSVNANYRDYKIPTEEQHRIFQDLGGMVSYALSRRSKFDLNVGYQSQRGRQINLDLFSARAKFTTILRGLTCVLGFDAYDRVYLENQKTNYIGAYIQIIKKFKY